MHGAPPVCPQPSTLIVRGTLAGHTWHILTRAKPGSSLMLLVGLWRRGGGRWFATVTVTVRTFGGQISSSLLGTRAGGRSARRRRRAMRPDFPASPSQRAEIVPFAGALEDFLAAVDRVAARPPRAGISAEQWAAKRHAATEVFSRTLDASASPALAFTEALVHLGEAPERARARALAIADPLAIPASSRPPSAGAR